MNPLKFSDKLFSKRTVFSPEEEHEAARKRREAELSIPRKRIRIAAMTIILMFMYSTLIFALKLNKPCVAFWVRYLMTMVEIPLIAIAIWSLTRERTTMNKFYNVPALRVLIFALSLHVGFNFVMIVLFLDLSWNYAILFDVGILGGTALLWLLNDSNSEAIKQQEKVQKKDTASMYKLQRMASRLPYMVDQEDQKLSKALAKLSTEFQYSDPVGTLETEQPEEQLFLLMTNLETALGSYAANPTESIRQAILKQCQNIHFELDQRNSWCIKSK